MDRIAAIEQSLTGFVCGIIGFLPVVGLIPAVYALLCWQRVRADYGEQWNPAAAYLKAGAVLATLGLLGSTLFIAVAILTMSDAFN
jgi:hypothetical protein